MEPLEATIQGVQRHSNQHTVDLLTDPSEHGCASQVASARSVAKGGQMEFDKMPVKGLHVKRPLDQ